MGGKHVGDAPGRSRTPVIAAVAAVVVIGAVAATAVAMTHDHGTTPPAASGPTSHPSASTSSSAPTSPTSSPTSGAASSPPAALLACQDETVAGDALAQAAAASARDWSMHTQAEVKLEDGTYTEAQTEADWEKSKARGPQDIDSFRSARESYLAKAGSCDKVARVDPAFTKQANACKARAAALAAVASTGAKVSDQWAAHVVMMANKEHTDADAYHQRWMAMVTAAPSALTPYTTAKSALDGAPACSLG